MPTLDYAISESVIDYSPSKAISTTAILSMLTPYDCIGVRKQRYGKLFDGGYVMADDFEGISAAYSLGISGDVSWDLDMANKGIKIFQFDHTIDRLPATHPLFFWEKTGVSSEHSEPGFKTLDDIVSETSAPDDRGLILKCDVEGHEWPILASCTSTLLARFRQIVIEVHALNALLNDRHADLIRCAVTNLSTHHRVIHVHANNYGSWAVIGGIPLPTVLELTLLRKDRGVFQPSTSVFPTSLDMPNNPSRADFPLGAFRFRCSS